MKFYAVKKGRKTGIYMDWGECCEQVSGYPGAIYKAFSKREDAVSFIEGSKKEKHSHSRQKPLIAYVDGSYNIDTCQYGFGCVLIDGQNVVEKLTGNGNDKDFVSMRNVAGEICGSLCAMNYAAKNGYDYLSIYYDYSGIEMWATGKWKTNKPGTRRYKSLVEQFKKHLSIRFVKVPAHSGVVYNEMADKLAKQSVGISA